MGIDRHVGNATAISSHSQTTGPGRLQSAVSADIVIITAAGDASLMCTLGWGSRLVSVCILHAGEPMRGLGENRAALKTSVSVIYHPSGDDTIAWPAGPMFCHGQVCVGQRGCCSDFLGVKLGS